MKALLCALLVLYSAVMASAHPMPSSEVRLRLSESQIEATLLLPIIELKLGWQKPLPDTATATVAQFGEDLKGYVTAHIHPTTPDGRPWSIQVKSVEPVEEKVPDVRVEVVLTPPAGAPTDHLNLDYDVILHQLITHTALVSIERDWSNGQLDGEPTLLDTLTDREHRLEIDRSHGSTLRGFASVVRLGMRHIAEGTDHLLFLLVLLLPAPLLAQGKRWGEAAGMRLSTMHLLKIVTAFTIGHSITLAAGALGWLRAPSQPVEVLIAISILVSAIHALRPLFPGRESLIAAGFGLVHGLAFATVIAQLGLDAWHTTLAILGFNIGIELMQLTVVCVTVPWLLLLARTPAYTPVRVIGAVVAGLAALGWVAERALGLANPIGIWVERAAANAIWIAVGLAVLSVGATLWQKRPKRVAAVLKNP